MRDLKFLLSPLVIYLILLRVNFEVNLILSGFVEKRKKMEKEIDILDLFFTCNYIFW